jgi:prepilin-type N-terminal cleavage/methylation domain-containing protein
MRKKNNKGFSLVELAMAMGLMAVLVGVVAAGGGMMTKSRVQREVDSIEGLRLATQNYLSSSSLTFTGVSVTELKNKGLVPATFDPLKANSFGGDYSVSANTADSTRVDIALALIPEDVGTSLSGAFKGRAEAIAYDKTTKIWKATF